MAEGQTAALQLPTATVRNGRERPFPGAVEHIAVEKTAGSHSLAAAAHNGMEPARYVRGSCQACGGGFTRRP
jgi:hypothetical protein